MGKFPVRRKDGAVGVSARPGVRAYHFDSGDCGVLAVHHPPLAIRHVVVREAGVKS